MKMKVNNYFTFTFLEPGFNIFEGGHIQHILFMKNSWWFHYRRSLEMGAFSFFHFVCSSCLLLA